MDAKTFLMAKKLAGSGGPKIEVEPLAITENGTYTAPAGKAYSPIEVSVPNPSTGELSITENGTYDVSEKASAVVNVPNPSTGTLSIDSNGTYDVTSYASAEVNVPSSGGGGDITSGVKFIDYDGTVVETWASASVASKTALPTNPTHTGLVAQGWNWSLANIKSYVAKYPDAIVLVGQMYKTSSGLTEMDITVTKATGKTVTCNMDGKKNWGDGTTGTATSHTYTNYGNYTITCNGTSIPMGSSSGGGMFGSTGSNNNRYWCTAIRIGERITSISSYAFHHCYSFAKITIPDSVTSINSYAFNYCRHIAFITIPDSVTSIGEYAFQYCHSIVSAIIPDSVTSIGNNAFSYCYSLTKITIPDSVTSIGSNAFNSCYSIIEYDFSSATSVPTLSNTNAFTNINGLCKIIVPDALYDSWIAATNWATYADYIYKASEVA